MTMRILALAVLLSMSGFMAGCTEKVPIVETPPPEPSAPNVTHPAPKDILVKKQTANQAATAQSPYTTTAEVEKDFNELLVHFAASGVGRYRFTIVNPNGTTIHDTNDQVIQTTPDSHTLPTSAIVYEVNPGKFKVQVEFVGAVSFDIKLVERNHEWVHQQDEPHHH
jgi:hypothetical protein